MSELLHSFAAGFIFFAGFVTGAAVFVRIRDRETPAAKTSRECLLRCAQAHEKSAANLARIANLLEYKIQQGDRSGA